MKRSVFDHVLQPPVLPLQLSTAVVYIWWVVRSLVSGWWCTCLVATCISGCMHMHASTGQVFLCTVNNQKDVFLHTVNNQKDVFLYIVNKDVMRVDYNLVLEVPG